MEILVVDRSIEQQARYANFIDCLPSKDLETLDLKLSITGAGTFMDFIDNTEVLVLGSGIQHQHVFLCRTIKSVYKNINIICFVDDVAYQSTTLKELYTAGAKKVFSNSVSEMDLLQELMSINFKLRTSRNKSTTKVTVVMSPKGGTGTTSITAALGEIASSFNKSVLLWDMDTRSMDLTRALSLFHKRNDTLRALLANEIDFNKKNFISSLIQVDANTSLLASDLNTFWNTKFLHDPSSRAFITRCLDLAKYVFSDIIIDLGSLSGYSAEVILEHADQILFVTGDCLIGASACDIDFEKLITKGFYAQKTKVLCNGSRINISTIKKQLEPQYKLGEKAWTLQNLDYDSQAFTWPSSGKTLYSAGTDKTKSSLLKIASELGLADKVVDGKKLLTHASLLNIKLGS